MNPDRNPDQQETKNASAYWRANLKVVFVLMTIWFIVAYVASIFGIQWLNQYQIGNLGLGFWMAQQGSIFVFVVLVFVYAIAMDWLDRKHGVGE